MAFVEGIGDEVVGLFVVLIVIAITALLWSTTHVQDSIPIVQVLPANSENTAAEISARHSLDPGINQSQEDSLGDTNSVLEEEVATISDQNEEPNTEDTTSSNQDPIQIRCQFLDETSLQVDTFLSEKISRLKTRHLIPHLGLNPLNGDSVRLIFNGRVLQGENQTLGESGIANNCVIHCLVHRRDHNNDTERNAERNENRNENGLDISDLDLSNVCYPLLGSVLMAIWWCQVVYAHYFTLTSTLSLVSLTVLYLASAANAYLHN